MTPPVEAPAQTSAREQTCLWLRANNIDPTDVPLDCKLHITTGTDEQETLHYEAFVRSASGNIMVDPERPDKPWRVYRAVRCFTEPPPELKIPGATTLHLAGLDAS